jgi:hypothetical protein
LAAKHDYRCALMAAHAAAAKGDGIFLSPVLVAEPA